jgi:hypothetical protein
MSQKVRQFCGVCQQITTQTRDSSKAEWKCLCCESAKFRSQQKTTSIRKQNKAKPRLNLNF